MGVVLVRSAILYLLVIVAVRFMGKRQLGQLQPAEFVAALLIADVASVPIQSTDIPLLYGIISIVVVAAFEVMISAISLKSEGFSRVLSGKSAIIIRRGRLSQGMMKKLRFTIDDMYEEMRQQNVTHLCDVINMTIETTGKISILTRDEKTPAKYGYEVAVIKDGKFDKLALESTGKSKKEILSSLSEMGLKDEKRVFIYSIDDIDNPFLLMKEEK